MAVEQSLQQPCSKKPADARLAAGNASSVKLGSDSVKTLQDVERSEEEAIENMEMVKGRSAEPTIARW